MNHGELLSARNWLIGGELNALLDAKSTQEIVEEIMFFERQFTYTSCANSTSQSITVKVGTPYFPAKTTGMEFLCACPYQIDAALSINEAVGIDHMQALGCALSIVHLYLSDLSAQGKLWWPDGRSYDQDRDCPISPHNSLKGVDLQHALQFGSREFAERT